MKTVLSYAWKTAACAVAHMIGCMPGGALATGLGVTLPSMPGTAVFTTIGGAGGLVLIFLPSTGAGRRAVAPRASQRRASPSRTRDLRGKTAKLEPSDPPPELRPGPHSYRSAFMGSTRAARMAGIRPATKAVATRASVATANVSGSRAFRP
jgi:hypothetical protein